MNAASHISRQPEVANASIGRLRAMRPRLVLASLVVMLGLVAPAGASAAADPAAHWQPSPDAASWTYAWSNSAYQSTRTLERYTVATRTDQGFRLAWTTDGLGNQPGAATSTGTIDYRYTDTGLVNTNWSSTPPPPQFPVLCASTTDCGNSLAGAHYQVIWGTRSPVLQEPLTQGATWSSTGGQASDVSSTNRYLGTERVVTEAFPLGVLAAKVESDITQAGALGDPFGSALRTTWWVYGVGPVKVVMQHAGGQASGADLVSTNLQPRPAPSDAAYLPLTSGATATYRYRNDKHLRRASVQKVSVAQVVNNTARVDVASVSGPIRLKGAYVFATRATGVTNLSAQTSAATRLRFPQLGPRALPVSRRRRFFTPLDLMTYGYNPVLQGYPAKGQTWRSSKSSRDFRVFGVTGTTKVVGFTKVTTPAGSFQALLVRSKLTQRGYPYGSGVRSSYFKPGVGLVKLVFAHGDGSTSTVELIK